MNNDEGGLRFKLGEGWEDRTEEEVGKGYIIQYMKTPYKNLLFYMFPNMYVFI